MTIVLATNGGPHSAATWATTLANQIVDYENLDSDKQVKATLLRAQVAQALERHFADVQMIEQEVLKAAPEHILGPIIVDIENAVQDVLKVTNESMWAKHFAQEPVIAAISDMIKSGFMTAAHIERSWFADANPDNQHVLAFRGQ